MAKWDLRAEVVAHLRRHPGHGDKRTARLFGVAHTTVKRWRREAGLATALKSVEDRRRRAELVAGPTLGETLVRRARATSAAKRRR